MKRGKQDDISEKTSESFSLDSREQNLLPLYSLRHAHKSRKFVRKVIFRNNVSETVFLFADYFGDPFLCSRHLPA